MNEQMQNIIKDYESYNKIEKECNNMAKNPVYSSYKDSSLLMLKCIKKVLRNYSDDMIKHQQNLVNMVDPISKELNLTKKQIHSLKLIASVHDIGKIAIEQETLNQVSKLNEAQIISMKTHTKEGYKIISSVKEFKDVAKIELYHHEKYDGTGYPYGLKGEQIPYLSRILSVLDVYDVILNGRVYKEPVSNNKAIAELNRCAGSQFDPKVVEAVTKVYGKNEETDYDFQLAPAK
jgi:HD-GYP domain-containing protein (c-di-GMP phosphodiesterase class II)